MRYDARLGVSSLRPSKINVRGQEGRDFLQRALGSDQPPVEGGIKADASVEGQPNPPISSGSKHLMLSIIVAKLGFTALATAEIAHFR